MTHMPLLQSYHHNISVAVSTFLSATARYLLTSEHAGVEGSF